MHNEETDTLPDVVFRIIVFIVCVSFVKQHLVLASMWSSYGHTTSLSSIACHNLHISLNSPCKRIQFRKEPLSHAVFYVCNKTLLTWVSYCQFCPEVWIPQIKHCCIQADAQMLLNMSWFVRFFCVYKCFSWWSGKCDTIVSVVFGCYSFWMHKMSNWFTFHFVPFTLWYSHS